LSKYFSREINMNTKILIALSLAVASLLVGCSSGDASTTEQAGSTASQGSTTVAEKAKCGGCGKEVAKAELASHDGAMLCKDCIAAHGH
jgi:hypothetical protein